MSQPQPTPDSRRAAPPTVRPSRPPRCGRARKVRSAAGGSSDRAFYPCSCGHAFEAAVSTSVQCPHCGLQQAW